MEYKTVLRARLPEISSDEDHLAWMREHVGPPAEDEPGWWTYRRDWKGAPYLKEVSWNGAYGVELVLMHVVEELDEGLAVTVGELMDHVAHLRGLVGDSPIKLFSYGWYNGVDEPIEW